VVDIGNGNFEQRTVVLTELEAPWIFAAQRHLEWFATRL